MVACLYGCMAFLGCWCHLLRAPSCIFVAGIKKRKKFFLVPGFFHVWGLGFGVVLLRKIYYNRYYENDI